jgi:hypothetical protein
MAKVQLFVGPEFLALVYAVRFGAGLLLIHYSEVVARVFRVFPGALARSRDAWASLSRRRGENGYMAEAVR